MSPMWLQITDFGREHLGLSAATQVRILWTAGAWVVYFALRAVFSRAISRHVADVEKKYLYTKSVNYTLSFTVLIATGMLWFGNFSGLATYLGIVSAGLAIALQVPLVNLAGWVFLTIRKPIALGDRVQIGSHCGDVIDMRLFEFTLVEIGNWVNADQSTGRIIHIPNGWIFQHSVANYAQGFNFIWNELPVTVTFESDWAEAKRILSDIADAHSLMKSQQAQREVRKAANKYMIHFQHLTPIVWTSVVDNGVTLTIRYLCEPRRRRSSETAMWEDILRAFARAGNIDFAYPTTRYFDNVSEGKREARAPRPADAQV